MHNEYGVIRLAVGVFVLFTYSYAVYAQLGQFFTTFKSEVFNNVVAFLWCGVFDLSPAGYCDISKMRSSEFLSIEDPVNVYD
jgi:hypothetical protein